MYDITGHYCIFVVAYFPEDDCKRLNVLGGLPHVCMLLYLIIVQLLEYIWRFVLLHGTWTILIIPTY